MNLKEFFQTVGGDYDTVSTRLPLDSMIKKFLLKFPADPSFNELTRSFKEDDVKGGFLAAHTLKGTSANLGLDALAQAASDLTEQLRNADTLPDISYFNAVESEYNNAILQISKLEEADN